MHPDFDGGLNMSERDSANTTSYVVYDRKTGRVVHTHQELRAEPSGARPPSEAEILSALKGYLPEKVSLGAISTTEPIAPRRGFSMFVDPASRTLVRLEGSAPTLKAASKPKTKAKKPEKKSDKKKRRA
jgi:hypothetical protein